MKRFILDFFALGIIGLVVATFFFRLFFPTPQLLVTPDIGLSDAWHFSFSTKYVLGESLHKGELPLWRNDIGGGFPLLGEGQTGTFYAPNLLLFSTLDPVTAYNLAMALTIFIFGAGMFLWTRLIGLHTVAALFVGLTTSFFAYPIMQLPHITLLQGTSLLPLLVCATIMLLRRPSYVWIAVFALLLSQQIFAGFPQATFLTLIVCACYVAWEHFFNPNWRKIVYFCVAILLGSGMAMAQLLPSWEFLRASAFPQGFDQHKASFFSFPLIDLASLFSPFAIGNPRTGTYPPAFLTEGNIVWENTIYLGILPLLLIPFAVIKTRTSRMVLFFTLAAICSLIFAWGKYSPLYFIYTIWPFNLFRVPSRFILLFAISLIMIAASSIHWIDTHGSKKVRIMLCIAISLHIIQLLSTFWSYHMLVPAITWLQKPAIASYLKPGRILTIGENYLHRQQFLAHGWSDPIPYYGYHDGISPDSNMIWDIPQHSVYAGRVLLRQNFVDFLLTQQSIQVTEKHATMSATTYKLLDLFAINTVVSFIPLDQKGLVPIDTPSSEKIHPSLYHNTDALPRAYLVHHAFAASTLEQAGKILQDPTIDPRTYALLEAHETNTLPSTQEFIVTQSANIDISKTTDEVKIVSDTHSRTQIHTNSQSNALLVLADTKYPGWYADIDGNPTPIITANFTHRAVVVPKGSHNITFTYAPTSLRHGIYISVGSAIVTIALVGFQIFVLNARIGKIVRPQRKHPLRSRDT